MPTQRTIYSTLEDVESRLAAEGVRPPAVVVIGGVVTIAAELAGLGRTLGGGDDHAPGAAPSPVPPLAKDNLTSINPGGIMEGKGMTAEESPPPGDNGEQNEKIGAKAHGGEIVPARSAVSPVDGN